MKAALALTAAGLTATAWVFIQADRITAPPTPGPGIVITEDDPRWDCHTMSNHGCGPGWVHPHIDCTRYETTCLANLEAGATWTPWHRYDGHAPCAILLGPTSLIACRDGFITTS